MAEENGRAVVRDRKGPKRAWALLTVYMWRRTKDEGIEGAPKVGHFSLAQQQGFMRWCRDTHKHSGKTISTYLSYIKAGLRFAATPRLIRDARGKEREVTVLSQAPHIADGEDVVSKTTQLPRSKPREWIPSDAEMAAILTQLRSGGDTRVKEREPTFRFAIMMLNTIARPEAITELSILKQVHFDRATIDLNPPGRPQNRKVRPVIRLTDNLRAWLLHWNLDRPIIYYGRPVLEVSNKTLKAAAERAEVAEWKRFSRYTFRHYMATRIRRVPGVTVTREERASWMGHTDPNHRTTEHWYESQDLDYLENVRQAIDGVLVALQALAKVPLAPPGAVRGTRLTVIGPEASERKIGEEKA